MRRGGAVVCKSIFLQRIGVRCVTDMMYLGCALPSSACSHYCSRIARLDGQSIASLNSDCNGGTVQAAFAREPSFCPSLLCPLFAFLLSCSTDCDTTCLPLPPPVHPL